MFLLLLAAFLGSMVDGMPGRSGVCIDLTAQQVVVAPACYAGEWRDGMIMSADGAPIGAYLRSDDGLEAVARWGHYQ